MNILGPSTVSVEAAQAWARKNNAHQRFIDVAPLYWSIAPRYGIPPEILYAQAAHETNWGKYTGVVIPEFHNFAGIKTKNATGDTLEDHQRFPSDEVGVLAHVQHLAKYAGAETVAASDYLVDPRWHLVTAFSESVEGLGGAWAPSKTYGVGIAKLTNDLRSFANDGTWPMAGDDSRFAWMPDTKEYGYPAKSHGRNGKPIDYLIIHVTEGTNSLGWLMGENGSSAHYLTNRDCTPRAQMVAEADAAWTAGNRDYNERGINIEFERFAREAWTGQEYKAAAETCYPILKRNSIPLAFLGRNSVGVRGLLGHEHVPDGSGGWGGATHHGDPGSKFDWGRFMAELRALDNAAPTPIPPTDDALVIEGVPIRLGFRDHFMEIGRTVWPADPIKGGIAVFGLPLAEEYATSFGSAQRFERYFMEWHRDNAPPFDIIGTLRGEKMPERVK